MPIPKVTGARDSVSLGQAAGVVKRPARRAYILAHSNRQDGAIEEYLPSAGQGIVG